MCGDASRASRDRRKRARAGGVARSRATPFTRRRPARRVWIGVGCARSTDRHRGRVRSPRPASGARRPGDGLRVGRPAGVSLARDDRIGGRLDRRPADQTDRRLVLASDRATRRCRGGRQAARRWSCSRTSGSWSTPRRRSRSGVRDAGRDGRRGSSGTRPERERVGRWRAVVLDVVAFGIARAPEERSEPAAPARQTPLAALRTHLPAPFERRWLVLGQRSGLLVLRVERAGQEPPVPSELDHHRVPFRAHLVGRFDPWREVVAGLHLRVERSVEATQERDPLAFATGDLVELLLHPRGEGDVHVVAEVLDQEVGDDRPDRLRTKAPLLHPDIPAIDDRRDGGGVRRGPADPVFLERLDEARLREARRRLGEVLRRGRVRDARDVALGEGRQAGPLLLVVGGVVIAALGVHPGEAVEERPW